MDLAVALAVPAAHAENDGEAIEVAPEAAGAVDGAVLPAETEPAFALARLMPAMHPPPPRQPAFRLYAARKHCACPRHGSMGERGEREARDAGGGGACDEACVRRVHLIAVAAFVADVIRAARALTAAVGQPVPLVAPAHRPLSPTHESNAFETSVPHSPPRPTQYSRAANARQEPV